MQTYLLMKLHDFFIELKMDFDEESLKVYVKDGDFWGDEIIRYKNIIIEEGVKGLWYLRIGRDIIYENEEGICFCGKANNEVVREVIRENVRIKVKKQQERSQKIVDERVDDKTQRVVSLYSEKINKHKELYDRILDKGLFQIECEFFIEKFLDDTGKLVFDDKYMSLVHLYNEDAIFENFFKKFLNLEECSCYIKSNITFENIKKRYPKIESFFLSQDDMKKGIEEYKKFFELICLLEREETDEEYQKWWWREKDKKEELKKALKEIYQEVHQRWVDRNEWRERYSLEKELKDKYTLEYVLSNNKKDIEDIENLEDMKRFLEDFLKNQNFFNETELKKEIESFFIRYKKHEEEYKKFIKQFGEDYYEVEYSEEKEARYQAGIYGENEKINALCMNKILNCFYDDTYIKGTTKYRPKIETRHIWIRYVKELVNTLLEYEVLLEVDGKLAFNKLDNINLIDREELDYLEWLKGKSCLEYKKQIIEEKERKYADKLGVLSGLILADSNFLKCRTKASRIKYLQDFIIKEFEEGRDNYFYCLGAYRHRSFKVCFQGETARKLIEELWSTLKEKNNKEIS